MRDEKCNVETHNCILLTRNEGGQMQSFSYNTRIGVIPLNEKHSEKDSELRRDSHAQAPPWKEG